MTSSFHGNWVIFRFILNVGILYLIGEVAIPAASNPGTLYIEQMGFSVILFFLAGVG